MDKINNEFVCYCVGEKFDKVMGGDGAIFEMTEKNCFITIGLSEMTEDDVSVFESGKLDTYLSVVEGIVFISAKFAEDFIFDMPFNAGLYKEFNFKNPQPYGVFSPIVILDNNTNIIKAMRAVGFDPDFSYKLYVFAKRQWENKIINYDERLKSVYSRYSPQDIIKHAIAKNIVKN